MSEIPMEIQDPAAFDMSISTLGRINFQLWKANEAQSTDNPDVWFKSLKIVYKEIDNNMKDKEREFHEDMHKRVEESFTEFIKYLEYYNQMVSKHKKIPFEPPRKIFDLLFSWEKELRRNKYLSELLMRKGDRADRAML